MSIQENEVKEYFNSLTEIKDVRKLFPVAESCVYLDNAHYSPYSLETNRRLKEYIDKFTFENYNLSLFNFKMSDNLKLLCAKLINVDKEEIAVTTSTTHGLNIFANGIKLNEGDKIAFADSEFPALVYPWLNQEKLRGLISVMIPSENGIINLEDIEKIISDQKVKVLTISSVGFLGYRCELDKISKICRDNDVYLVVDAIQSTGIIPIDVKQTDIDFLAMGSQKWMQSPSGIGFCYVNKNILNKINPTYVGTTSIKYDFKNFLNYKLDFDESAKRFENSTLNTLGMIGMCSSLELFMKIGVENIFNHIKYLLDIFEELIDKEKYEIKSLTDQIHRSNILIFSAKDKSKNEKIQKLLEEKNIFIALREGFLRVSPHIFNNKNDIEKLIFELNKLN
ncbi:MAG TPA: aminotransferase class V-fold PLP-dependent enzyme [Ignavibacteria bacterium]|nr:aminotransferase class V-fold PLP-dependent enzyme [Ignavibacteria bacterium]